MEKHFMAQQLRTSMFNRHATLVLLLLSGIACFLISGSRSAATPYMSSFHPSPYMVQHTNNVVKSNTLALAFTSNVTGGNTLVVCASSDLGANMTVADNRSNKYNLAAYAASTQGA